MESLRGRAGVVIGGGSGIGRGIALALAEAGVRVCVADLNEASAKAVAEELRGRGATALAAGVDVTQPASLEALAERAFAELGAVHVLSNNAGVIHLSPLAEATDADWQWVLSVNLHGLIHSVQAFLPRLLAQGEPAHIVNTASLAGLVGDFPGLGLYTASKFAAVGYSETLRAELAPHGIGVSVLCPGLVQTKLATTSARQRPARFGGPLQDPEHEGPLPPQLPVDPEAAMSAEECGRRTLQGIRLNRSRILTHPETREIFEARVAGILEDYEALG